LNAVVKKRRQKARRPVPMDRPGRSTAGRRNDADVIVAMTGSLFSLAAPAALGAVFRSETSFRLIH